VVEARLKKWGNSLGVRIPQSIAKDVGLTEDSVVDLRAEDGRLVIRLKAKSYKLDELLAQVTDTNVHPETNWGQPLGKEIW